MPPRGGSARKVEASWHRGVIQWKEGRTTAVCWLARKEKPSTDYQPNPMLRHAKFLDEPPPVTSGRKTKPVSIATAQLNQSKTIKKRGKHTNPCKQTGYGPFPVSLLPLSDSITAETRLNMIRPSGLFEPQHRQPFFVELCLVTRLVFTRRGGAGRGHRIRAVVLVRPGPGGDRQGGLPCVPEG